MSTESAPAVPARALPWSTVACLVIAGLAAVAYFIGLWTDSLPLRLVAKPVPILALAAWVGLSRPGPVGIAIGVGLLFSVVGDVLLEIPADLFVFGLLAFLVAHLVYIVGAVLDTRRLALLRAVPVLVYCGVVYGVLFPGMGEMAVPVAVYVTVIGTMLWRMAARVDGRPAATLALVGAIVFAVSDSVIAIRKFGVDFALGKEIVMVTYYGGQALLAASVAWPGLRDRGR